MGHERPATSRGAIRDLVRDWMQLVIESRKDIRETRREMREMLPVQKRTEKNFGELTAALAGCGKTHFKPRINADQRR
jgi:hypothetical protein